MARALSLVLSVLLVSSSTLVSAGIGKGVRRLLNRDVLEDFEDCTGSEWETDLVNHHQNAILKQRNSLCYL